MSTSYNAGVILGVKLNEIGFNAKLNRNKYEVYDRKGNKTGKFDTDYSWEIDFQGNKSTYNYRKLYQDVIEDIINIDMPLELFDNNNPYVDDIDIDNFVLGIDISEKGYDDNYVLMEIRKLEIDTNEKMKLVKSELKKQFNVDIEPKLYFYFNIS